MYTHTHTVNDQMRVLMEANGTQTTSSSSLLRRGSVTPATNIQQPQTHRSSRTPKRRGRAMGRNCILSMYPTTTSTPSKNLSEPPNAMLVSAQSRDADLHTHTHTHKNCVRLLYGVLAKFCILFGHKPDAVADARVRPLYLGKCTMWLTRRTNTIY